MATKPPRALVMLARCKSVLLAGMFKSAATLYYRAESCPGTPAWRSQVYNVNHCHVTTPALTQYDFDLVSYCPCPVLSNEQVNFFKHLRNLLCRPPSSSLYVRWLSILSIVPSALVIFRSSVCSPIARDLGDSDILRFT